MPHPITTAIIVYDGIFFTPWDIIKGILFGVASYGVCEYMGIPIEKTKDAFIKGFILGGYIGGLEEVLDAIISNMVGENVGAGTPTIDSVVHELFQSMLLNGIIAGTIMALIKKIR